MNTDDAFDGNRHPLSVRHDAADSQVSVESGALNVSAGPWWRKASRDLVALQTLQVETGGQIRNLAMASIENARKRNPSIERTTAGEIARETRLLGGVSYTHVILTRAADGALDGKHADGESAWGRSGIRHGHWA